MALLFILTVQARPPPPPITSSVGHTGRPASTGFFQQRLQGLFTPMFSHPHTRNKPLLKFALLSCLTLLFLLLFIFLTSGYANPHSTIYRYTHGYSEKYRSWLSSKLGVSKDSVQPPGAEDTEYEAEDEGKPQRTFNIALTERAGHHDEVFSTLLSSWNSKQFSKGFRRISIHALHVTPYKQRNRLPKFLPLQIFRHHQAILPVPSSPRRRAVRRAEHDFQLLEPQFKLQSKHTTTRRADSLVMRPNPAHHAPVSTFISLPSSTEPRFQNPMHHPRRRPSSACLGENFWSTRRTWNHHLCCAEPFSRMAGSRECVRAGCGCGF